MVITEPLNLPPGDVEIVVWQATETLDNTTTPASEPAPETPKRKSRIKAFQSFFENSPPVPPDFDPDPDTNQIFPNSDKHRQKTPSNPLIKPQ